LASTLALALALALRVAHGEAEKNRADRRGYLVEQAWWLLAFVNRFCCAQPKSKAIPVAWAWAWAWELFCVQPALVPPQPVMNTRWI